MTKQEFKKMDQIIEEATKQALDKASDVKSIVNFTSNLIKEALHEGMEED
jgi:hypothetical protein